MPCARASAGRLALCVCHPVRHPVCSYLVLPLLPHPPPHPPQAEDGSCTAMEYDTAKAKETRTQLLMGGLICVGVHYKWGYMQVPRRSPARRRGVPMPPPPPHAPRSCAPRSLRPRTRLHLQPPRPT